MRRIVELPWRHRLSPLAIASRLSMPASNLYAVFGRCRLNRLSHIDIRTGEPIRRYEHDRPGSLIHVDVKKLGNIPEIPTNSHAGQPCRAGCTPTITTGNTLRSATSHPSPG